MRIACLLLSILFFICGAVLLRLAWIYLGENDPLGLLMLFVGVGQLLLSYLAWQDWRGRRGLL